MTADHLAFALIIAAAPAATLYPIIYGLTAPWWRTLLGRALMTKAVGVALLIDISLFYAAFGDDYALRDVVRLTVYVLITGGVWLALIALIQERRRAAAERR